MGRGVAFGLVALKATRIRLFELDPAKAEVLAADLRMAAPEIGVATTAVEAASGATGLVNCTPVGMAVNEGTPLDEAALRNALPTSS
ncbi:Shikimate dehydrogenase (NADP(+)) [Defluviimonas aquaemixtae]|uniref:Shikimate dehydrogenase (NADP(+)) n=1 Tax=Albidovulum aquaemixtae TaxID=1542388 RepID=A0A2R8BLG4_9RHOB|nr:hypothetical protein [Defluviimonas aquaemixtae]SPH24269.1 Shikimate dehydrogenase (NADP(+)) [Defluviimonas aquaemixtae]